MTKEQIISICDKYTTLMGSVNPIRESNIPNSMRHIKWMCIEIPELLKLDKTEKANRWLGFVQGVLWSNKIITIEELKDDNR